tara:strand:- start:6033 stop:6347 length:315 start_codon:yes stop_codon:yes gene_type:complete
LYSTNGKTNKMTQSQKNTIDRLTIIVEKINGKQTVSFHDIRKSHILLSIFNIRKTLGGAVVTTTEFVNVDINTKGKVVKGYVKELRPNVTTVYPYFNDDHSVIN